MTFKANYHKYDDDIVTLSSGWLFSADYHKNYRTDSFQTFTHCVSSISTRRTRPCRTHVMQTYVPYVIDSFTKMLALNSSTFPHRQFRFSTRRRNYVDLSRKFAICKINIFNVHRAWTGSIFFLKHY